MKRKKRIYKILSDNLKEFSIQIIDNSHLHIGHNEFDGKKETHLKIILTSRNSVKINRIDIHRQINRLLKNEYNSGLHSLEIKLD